MLIKIFKTFVEKDVSVEFTYFPDNFDTDLQSLNLPATTNKLQAKWIGSEIPKIGMLYDVEIAIENEVDWEANVKFIDKAVEESIVKDKKGAYRLVGFLQITDPDFVTLQIGNALISLNIRKAPAAYSGYVEITTSSILLYDTNTLKYTPTVEYE